MKRVGRLSSYIGKRSFWQLWRDFLIMFALVALLFTVLYLAFGRFQIDGGSPQNDRIDWANALYFSFATQLTLGANNITPKGLSQIIVVLQSIAGLGLFGIWSGLAVASFISAHPNTIQLANWAGYDLANELFFVIFINKNVEKLENVKITKIVKLGNYNPVKADINPPYIGYSLWALQMEYIPITELAKIHLSPGDGIKFGISGTAGITTYTSSRKYKLDEIFIVRNSEFLHDEKYDDPRSDSVIEDILNYPPEDAICITEFDFDRFQK